MTGFELLLDIGGGVALLLWATRTVRTGIERAYGASLRRLLGYSTRNRIYAFGTGLGVAAALQSSTATGLLTISFATGGLLQTAPALAVMLGADVGSTLVVQALSLKIAWLSPALILVGVTLFFTSSGRKIRQLGRIILGLGMMLLSLKLIVDASLPLRESTALGAVIAALEQDPMTALVLGAILTWLAHSSVAVVLLIMSLASAGLAPLVLALALVLGANVGSGLIPVTLTWRAERAARRILLGNFLLRLTGALALVGIISLIAPYFVHLGAHPARQVANFHTVFNLALALAFLPLTGIVAKLIYRLLPDHKDTGVKADAPPVNPSYLDPDAIGKPRLALACATREALRMADRVEAMLRKALAMFQADDAEALTQIGKMDDEVDEMNTAIKLYLTDVSRNQLGEEESRRCMELTTFTIKLEHIGDIIAKNLLPLARKKLAGNRDFSKRGWEELSAMHARVVDNMQLALNVFVSKDLDSARALMAEKDRFRELESKYNAQHLARLRAGQVASIETSTIHLDIVRDLKQINSHLATVSYPILQAAGDLLQSRLRERSNN